MILNPPNLILFLLLSISSLAPAFCHPSAVQVGYFSHYTQAPTDGTIDYHQNESGLLPQDLSPYAGVIAVVDCALVGRDAWIYLTDQRVEPGYRHIWLRVKIFACSGHSQTTLWMEENRILGELGHYLATDIGVYNQGGIAGEIMFENPATAELVCNRD